MSKFVRRLTAVVLLAIMVTGLAAMVSADKPEKATLVCIGDSVPAGYDMNTEDTSNPLNVVLQKGGGTDAIRKVSRDLLFYGYNHNIGLTNCDTNSFSRQVADFLGYEYVDMTSVGIRVTEAYAMFSGTEYPGGGFLPDGCTMGEVKGITGTDAGTEITEFYGKAMRKEVEKASVVVLSMGANDLLTVPLMGDDESSIREAKQKLLEALPLLLKEIKAVNPDCEVLLLGYYNPISKMSVTRLNERALSLTTSLVTFLNTQYAAIAAANGATYVDISGTSRYFEKEVMDFGDTEELFLNLMVNHSHPNQEGHDYIASRILKKLETNLKKGELITYFGDNCVGELTYIRSGLGWVIKVGDGKYLNSDGTAVTEASKATVWKHQGGFYVKEESEKGFLGRDKKVKKYLTFEDGSWVLSSDKVKTAFYEVD